eukprot:scaffold414_cov109-Cylindrotheca_fusiformis.AAC.19
MSCSWLRIILAVLQRKDNRRWLEQRHLQLHLYCRKITGQMNPRSIFIRPKSKWQTGSASTLH